MKFCQHDRSNPTLDQKNYPRPLLRLYLNYICIEVRAHSLTLCLCCVRAWFLLLLARLANRSHSALIAVCIVCCRDAAAVERRRQSDGFQRGFVSKRRGAARRRRQRQWRRAGGPAGAVLRHRRLHQRLRLARRRRHLVRLELAQLLRRPGEFEPGGGGSGQEQPLGPLQSVPMPAQSRRHEPVAHHFAQRPQTHERLLETLVKEIRN